VTRSPIRKIPLWKPAMGIVERGKGYSKVTLVIEDTVEPKEERCA